MAPPLKVTEQPVLDGSSCVCFFFFWWGGLAYVCSYVFFFVYMCYDVGLMLYAQKDNHIYLLIVSITWVL